MLYVIIGLNVLIIILVVISITKNINESNITERLGKLETNMVKEVGSFQNFDLFFHLLYHLSYEVFVLFCHFAH